MSAFSLDRRSALLVAIFPSLAIGLLNQFYLELAYQQGLLWFYLADAIQWIVTPILVWLFVLRPARIRLSDYGLRVPVSDDSTLESVGLFVFVTVLLWIASDPVRNLAYRFFWPYAGTFGYGSAIPTLFPWNVMVPIYYSVTAAFVEEVVFRGLSWAYFSAAVPSHIRKRWYIIVTSILFAAIHSEQGPHGVISALSYGVVAAYLYSKLKNLWPLVFGHFVINMINFWPK